MRTLFLFLTIGFISPLLWAGEGGDKKKDKNKDQYYKYEREDVSSYRDRRTFDMPPLPEPTIVEVEEVDPETISLEPLFRGGRKVYLDADERLGLMVARDSILKSQIDKLPGYRIQIYADVGRQGAIRTKSLLMQYYPGVANYLTYRAPNYVIRVGDFLDKEEAIIFTRKLKETFPNAFVAPDKVNLPREFSLEKEEPIGGQR
jgi:hypothetical protein